MIRAALCETDNNKSLAAKNLGIARRQTLINKIKESPADHALDYDTLRREGIKHIERPGSTFWTDYNTHDPGITILEQLCYAITNGRIKPPVLLISINFKIR